MLRLTSIAAALVTLVATLAAQERLDFEALSRIQEEGLKRSQVMEHLTWLSDVHGPRLTGSPGLSQAGEWAVKTMTGWGLSNPRLERWKFGKGWSLKRFSAHMIEPQVQPLIGYPKSWTPGTAGTVTGDVVRVSIGSDADFERYRGKLSGKIALLQSARDVRMLEGRVTWRMDAAMLAEAENLPVPTAPAPPASPARSGPTLQDRIQQFLLAEGVLVALDRGTDASMVAMGGAENLSAQTQRTDGGTIFSGSGGPRDENAGKVVPQVTLAVEHYNRMVRLVDRGVPVRAEFDIQAQFHDETDMNGFNVIADIPGSDLAQEVVLLGAHIDSYHLSTGATDNGVGVAAMMEAMRILTAVGVKPRRTIRVALWGGEEQGLMGARAYVRQHLADAATMQLKPGHPNLVAYYNIDNGTGRIRGVWMQGNLAIAPIFKQWIEPLRGLGVSTLSPRIVSGSDYVAFDEVGIPAFQFIQDRLEYNSRTHHSNMDVYDRVQRDDAVQMAVVAATFAYNTAMRDEKLPRKPLPVRPARPAKPTQP
jgi:carboxypeptidase Q